MYSTFIIVDLIARAIPTVLIFSVLAYLAWCHRK